MKISSVLCIHLIFLGLFNGYFSFNPERVILQGSEDDGDKTDEMQVEESLQKAFRSEEGPRFIIRRTIRPIKIGSQIYWVEVRREFLDRRQHPSSTPQPNFRRTTEKSFINDGKITGNNKLDVFPNDQSSSRRTTERSIIKVNSEPSTDGIKSQMPPNRIGEDNNNSRENSNPINSSLAATGGEEEFFEYENPEKEVTKSPGRISPDSNFFAGIVNDFAFKLVETLNLESNFVISPLSIFVALSMCYLGADGLSKTQMEQALGMNDNAIHGEHLHQGIKDLLSLVLNDPRGYKLSAANGMFLGQNFAVDAQFEENVKKYYDAELKNLDFGNPRLSQRIINDWVAQNTENIITSIIDSPPSPAMRLILLNAVYFQGYWKTPFPPSLTNNRKFHTLNGDEKEVPFMYLSRTTFPVFRSDEHKHTFIKLPYEGDQLSMIIALPYTEGQSPMPSVTDEILCHVLDAMKETYFDIVAIPKFRLEYGKSLVESLKNLGVKDIFDSRVADLTKLRKNKDVYVSDIMHKAVVEVNEVGTTASAVTSIGIMPTSARRNTLVADHPFAFYIVHEASGLVLFYGKVMDIDAIPKANEND